MSFLHDVRVGFFGAPEEKLPARELGFEECMELLDRFGKTAPEELQVKVEPAVRSNPTRAVVLAYADGFPIVLKAGVLICPYLATSFILGSIAFVAFLCQTIGCSIYSDDEGRFLTLQEFIPTRSFADIMREVIQNQLDQTDS